MTEVSAEELYDGAETTEEILVVEEPKGEEETKQEETTEEVVAESEEETKDGSPPSVDETKVPISAMHGERDRRQAAESRAKELEEQLAEANKSDPVSVFEDEPKFREELQSQFDARLTSRLLDFSERVARKLHGSELVDESIDWFKDAAKLSPVLQQQFNDAGNDVDEIVTMYQGHLEAEKLKDVDGYKAKLKAEVRAEVEAELEATAKAKADLRDSIPESLAGDTSAGGISSKGSYEPPTAEELYN